MNGPFEDQVIDLPTQLFCMDQDWKPGDGTASQVDEVADKLLTAHERAIQESEEWAYLPALKWAVGESPDAIRTHGTIC